MVELPPQPEVQQPGALRFGDGSGWRQTRRVAGWTAGVFAALVVAYLAVCSTLVVSYRWVDPPTTAVQFQRRIEALAEASDYSRAYVPVRSPHISTHILNAVVAAEDNRFFEHLGFDWDAIETAYKEGGRRGGSTVSQQLAKNLFLTTHRSYLRKALEVPLTVAIELILPKERILELYVNVAEWGDGVFGVEAASRRYFSIGADRLSRRQSAALASCLPDPRRRRPRLDGRYTTIILRRMDQLGY
jgi:monofunctional biosynthetic peptidoglycan transglycosylase